MALYRVEKFLLPKYDPCRTPCPPPSHATDAAVR